RDLALRNLLVTTGDEEKYIVKVADFGLSRITDKGYYKTSDKTMPVKWRAPESLEYGSFSSKSDVWSFGVVLWELFSYGKLPYTGLSNKETIEKVLNGYQMPPPEGCPKEMAELMADCWYPKAEARPTFKKISERFNEIYIQYQ